MQKDAVAAVKWWRKAANQGEAKAQYNLGVVYAKGIGAPIDAIEAYAFFNLASVQDEKALKSSDLLAKQITTK